MPEPTGSRDHAHPEVPTSSLRVVAPVSGRVVPLADVPDAVFAQEIVGPGTALEPEPDGVVVSPVSGVLASLFPHAFAIETPGGRTVLVHLGIDTVTLRGQGFSVHAAVGDEVAVGQHLLSWDVAAVAAAGLATVCPVVAIQAEAGLLELLVRPGQQVRHGDPLLEWGTAP